jgi:hypothetical protein
MFQTTLISVKSNEISSDSGTGVHMHVPAAFHSASESEVVVLSVRTSVGDYGLQYSTVVIISQPETVLSVWRAGT